MYHFRSIKKRLTKNQQQVRKLKMSRRKTEDRYNVPVIKMKELIAYMNSFIYGRMR